MLEIVRGASGRGVICNRPDNGLKAIEDFGAQHVAEGDLIVYTSQDSVLQIAAHVDVVAPEALYDICRRVRDGMTGEHAVGRVIARPFAGCGGAFERTDGRRDYALAPPGRSYLEELQAARRSRARGGQGGAAVRRRRHRRRASRRDQRARAGRDRPS